MRWTPVLLVIVPLCLIALAHESPEPPDPWAWRESFTNFERLWPVTTSDFGLSGPVASVTLHTYYLDPQHEPPVRRAVSRGNPVHTRQLFDELGNLRESQYISPEGEPLYRYRYEFEDGFYLGFAELDHTARVRESFRRRRASEGVVAVWDSPDRLKAGEYRYRYDQTGRLLVVERFSPGDPGILVTRESYRYDGERLMERRWTNGHVTRYSTYEYRPHPLIEGELLLAEQRNFSDEEILRGRGEEQVNINPDHNDLLRGRTLSYYHPDGSLAGRQHVRVDYRELGLRQETVMSIEEYENSRLVREISGPGEDHVIDNTRTYLYGDGGRLVKEIWYPGRGYPPSLDSIRLCEYRGFDEHGNWTDYACAYSVELSDALELPEEFNGELVTREITYH